ncbi:class I SAM-dependent methyltransferase [Parasphingopyxis marina]|uniref:Class I SAM-dependent methyltransferase n=1 Tax=Parasphingopyxis marina TaxID=2761622 RepID=A0A842HWZ2_9SPHN|nr:class I SAM-dependent methyltransferase [Parasphingopyxis marina]MBC2778658.1 class I SAM-dependent methyltransferase [Parasphingopyxis marina]
MELKVKRQRYDDASLIERGEARAKNVVNKLKLDPETLRGKRFLEIGCGFGEFCAAIEDLFGAAAVGVDPTPRSLKGPFADRPFYKRIDITSDEALTLGQFDHAASFDVLEHVENPKRALENIFAMLKPGGTAFLKYNLHRGASASHLIHQTGVPWCHLVMSDEEIEALTLERTGEARKPAWVNKATYAHYLIWFEEIGFIRRKTHYVTYPMEPAFYEQHREKLERYPMDDLEKNFMVVTVEKPGA